MATENTPLLSVALAEAVHAPQRKYVWGQANINIYRISDRGNGLKPIHVYVDITDAGKKIRVQWREGIGSFLQMAGLHDDPEEAMKHAEKLFDEIVASR